MAILPIDLTTFLSVFAFTFLFDLIDLHPQIGSFRFVGSATYVAYYFIRVVFGLLASSLLQLTRLFPSSIVLAFVSVVASVTTLNNFSLKLGGENVADLPSLFETYRKKMVDDQLKRNSRKTLTEQTQLTCDLSEKFTEDVLEKQVLSCLHVLYPGHDEKDEVQKIMDEINAIAGQDSSLRRMLLAQEIVNINPDYAKQLLEIKRKRDSSK